MKYLHIPSWPIVAFLSFLTPDAYASCYFNGAGPSGGEPHYIYRAITTITDFHPNPNSLPIGQRIGSIQMRMLLNSIGTASYSCSPFPSSFSLDLFPGPTIRENGAYPSGIPGIGIFSMTIDDKPFPREILSIQSLLSLRPNDIRSEIILVRTGTIRSLGPFNGTFAYETVDGQRIYEYRFNEIPAIIPQKPTCALQPISTVPLGTHAITKFTQVGTTTQPQDFEVQLACSGGDPGTSTTAHVTLTDNSDTSNTSDVLSLYSSHVTGIGVQILRNGRALRFGPQGAVIGSPHVWEAGTITPGNATFRIPLQARYLQTGPVTGGGQANAQALLTINYQ